jgi:hypothetical protein
MNCAKDYPSVDSFHSELVTYQDPGSLPGNLVKLDSLCRSLKNVDVSSEIVGMRIHGNQKSLSDLGIRMRMHLEGMVDAVMYLSNVGVSLYNKSSLFLPLEYR